MDRFSEQAPADLARSFRLNSRCYPEFAHFTPTIIETCTACDTSFTLEKGTELPITKCASPNCPVLLCPCCPQFQCDGCGQTFCIEHAIEEQQEFECTCQRTDVDVYDASWCFSCNPSIRPRPTKLCAACLEEAEVTDWGTEEISKVEPVSSLVAIPNIPKWAEAGSTA